MFSLSLPAYLTLEAAAGLPHSITQLLQPSYLPALLLQTPLQPAHLLPLPSLYLLHSSTHLLLSTAGQRLVNLPSQSLHLKDFLLPATQCPFLLNHCCLSPHYLLLFASQHLFPVPQNLLCLFQGLLSLPQGSLPLRHISGPRLNFIFLLCQ